MQALACNKFFNTHVPVYIILDRSLCECDLADIQNSRRRAYSQYKAKFISEVGYSILYSSSIFAIGE